MLILQSVFVLNYQWYISEIPEHIKKVKNILKMKIFVLRRFISFFLCFVAHTALKQYVPILQMRQVINGARQSKMKARELKGNNACNF